MILRPSCTPLFTTLAIFALSASLSDLFAQNRTVDFRWAPENYVAVVGLPDDWQKTMVSETGSLTYDFGPGPYARGLTTITFGLEGQSLIVNRQGIPDGRTPIVETMLSNSDSELRLLSLSLIPDNYTSPKPGSRLTDKVSRLDGMNGARGWVKPAPDLDPAFANVAWGTNRAIRYQVDVEPGRRYKIATGFLEGWKSTAGARPLEIHVEGSIIRTIDPLADGVKGKAYVHLFDAADINSDGKLNIEVHPSAQGPDPNTMMNAFWVFSESFDGSPESIAQGSHNKDAFVYHDCGLDSELSAPFVRNDLVVAYSNSDLIPLELRIASNRDLVWIEGSRTITSQGRPFVALSHTPVKASQNGRDWIFTLPKGVRNAYATVIHGASPSQDLNPELKVADELDRAQAFWESNTIVAQNVIQVPDQSIQFLADASLRNMYQVRDFVNGDMQFQPGPSVYRGLWVTDFNQAAALATGDTASVRTYLETILAMPTQDGHFRAMVPNVSLYENPTFLAAVFFYARATGNSSWLNTHWAGVQSGMDWMIRQREATLADPSAPNYGLLPAGFVDGGISELNADYGSAMWTLTTLEYGIVAAQSIGRTDEAARWKRTFDDMLTSMMKAMERDLQTDSNGTPFLPTLVGAKNPKNPQLGSYGFIWPAKFSHYMHDDSTRMGSVMDINLRYYETQLSQGLLAGTGWLSDGLWHWLSAMHGSVQLKHGWRNQAIETLYALSNHASPTGVWVEEQLPAHLGNRTTGDVSNAQSSAAYYLLVRDLIAFETEQDIILFRGVPSHWLEPGKSTKLDQSYTLFGPLHVSLETAPDNVILTVTIDASNLEKSGGKVLVDTTAIREAGFKVPDQPTEVTFGSKAQYTFMRE